MKYDVLLGSGNYTLVGLVGTLEEVKQQVIYKTAYNEKGLKTVKLIKRENGKEFSDEVFKQKIDSCEFIVFN